MSEKKLNHMCEVLETIIEWSFISLIFNLFFVFIPFSWAVMLAGLNSEQFILFFSLWTFITMHWLLIGVITYTIIKKRRTKWCGCGDEILIEGDKCETCKFMEEENKSEGLNDG